MGKIHFSENDVKNMILSLKEDFAFVRINTVANNAAFICKCFYVLPSTKELNFDNYLSDQAGSNNYTFINNKTKSQIINERSPLSTIFRKPQPSIN